MKIYSTVFVILFLLGALPVNAAPPPPSGGPECVVTTSFYIVHYSAFQPPKDNSPGSAEDRMAAFRPYCRQLPRTGKTYFGIDFIDRDVRQLPIGLSVVEEKTGPEGKPETVRTLRQIPPKLYPNGVAELQVDFDKPGKYTLLVQFGEEGEAFEDDILRIPLEVGLASFDFSIMGYLAAAAVVVFFALIWFFLRMATHQAAPPVEKKG